MVEGHAVQRLAAAHRQSLLRRSFRATSPNERFKEGASAIDGRTLVRVEAIGKNLFHFYSDDRNQAAKGGSDDIIVMHCHFGMSGQFRTCPTDAAPDTKPTTRLRLEEIVKGESARACGVTAMVSAQLLVHGGLNLYDAAKSRLGEDPLREDADPALFFAKAYKSRKSIGALLMDQGVIAGVGNVSCTEVYICFYVSLSVLCSWTCHTDWDECGSFSGALADLSSRNMLQSSRAP
jgi:endonuclease VIII